MTICKYSGLNAFNPLGVKVVSKSISLKLMNMELYNKIRNFVVIISLIIFFYQITVALHKLMSDSTVDSSEYIPISQLTSPPVITFCPRKQIDSKKLNEEFGYIP